MANVIYAAISPFWPISTKDIPALRTVIIADMRASSDISVLQAAMRSLRLHKSKANDTAQILQVASWSALFFPARRSKELEIWRRKKTFRQAQVQAHEAEHRACS